LFLREHLPEHLKEPVTFSIIQVGVPAKIRALKRLRPEISKSKDGRLLPIKAELLEIIERAKQKRLLACPRVFHEKCQPMRILEGCVSGG
jgi:hypothetical protein